MYFKQQIVSNNRHASESNGIGNLSNIKKNEIRSNKFNNVGMLVK